MSQVSKCRSPLNTSIWFLVASGEGKGVQCRIMLETDSVTFRPNLHFIFTHWLQQPEFCLSFSGAAVFSTGRLLRGFEHQPVQTCFQKLTDVKWCEVCEHPIRLLLKTLWGTLNILNPRLNQFHNCFSKWSSNQIYT